MTKALKRIGLVLGAILLLAALLMAAGVAYIHSHDARQRLQQLVNERIKGNLSFENLDLSLRHRELTLHEIRIDDAQGDPVLTLPRLHVRVDPWALRNKALVLERIEIDRPDLNLAATASGAINIAEAFSPVKVAETPAQKAPASKTAFQVRVDEIQLNDGALRWADAAGDLGVELQSLNLKGGINTAPLTATLQVSAGKGMINQGDRSFRLHRLALAAGFTDNRLSIDSLALSLDQASMTITGDIDLTAAQAPRFNLEARLESSVSTLRSIMDIDRPLEGTLIGSLDLKGSLTEPLANLAVTVTEASIAGDPVAPLTAEAHLKARQFTMRMNASGGGTGTLTIEAAADLEPLFPQGFVTTPQDFSKLSYHLKLNADQWHPQGLALPIQGSLSGDLSLAATGIDPRRAQVEATFDLSGTNLTTEAMPSPMTADLSGGVRLEKGTLQADRIKGLIADTRVDLSGHYPLDGGAFDVLAQIDAPELARSLTLVGINDISGQLLLDLKAQGTTAEPAARATITGKNLNIKSYAIDQLTADLAISPLKGVRLSNLLATRQTTRVSGSAHLPWREDLFSNPVNATIEVALDFTNLDLGDFVPPEFVTGVINGRLIADGRLAQPALTLSASGRDMTTMGYRLGAVRTQARFEQGRLHVAPLVAQDGAGRTEINGDVWLLMPDQWRLLKDPRFDLKLSGRDIQLADFWPQVTAKADLEAQVRGPWSALEGEGSLQAETIDFGYQKIDALTTTVRLADSTVFIDEAQVSLSEQSRLKAHGWIAFDGRYDAAIETVALDLTDVEPLQLNQRVEGILRGRLEGQGSISNPAVNGRFDLSQTRINDLPLSDTRLKVALKEGQLELDGQQAELSLAGAYHLVEHHFHATLEASGLDLAPYFIAFGKKDLSGSFSGSVAVSGDSDAISQMRANITIKTIELATPRLELLRTAPFEASFHDGHLTIPNLKVSFLDQGDLVIQGQGSLEGPLDFSAEGKFPFAALEIFTDAVAEPKGTLRIAAQLTGTAPNPVVAGEVRLDNLSAVLPQLNQKISSVNGTLRITDKALTVVDELAAKMDGGRLAITGNVTLTDLKPSQLDLRLAGYQLPFSIVDTMDLTANARLNLQGDWQQAKLSGQVELIEGLYYKDVNISVFNTLSGIATGLVRRNRVTQTQAVEIPANPFLRNLRLDIGVGSRNPIEVDNNLAQLSVAPDLQIRGPVHQLIITGRAAVEEGVVFYQNNRFIIKRGVIDFINPQRTTPAFDIESDVTVRQWLITLRVTGPPEALEFELSSNPPLDDQDILSLLLSGRTFGELVEGEGGNSQATARMLADLIVSQYGETIRNVTGLDIIETVPNEPDDDGNIGVKVTLGKNLTERMQVKYDLTDRAGEFEGRVRAEYRFLENIFLSGFQENSGAFGGALTFRLEFR